MAVGTLITSSDTSSLSSGSSDSAQLDGKANQHRVWWNSYKSRWDGIIRKYDSADSNSESDGYIAFDVPNIVDTDDYKTEVITRNTERHDCHWDDSNRNLYVVGFHPTTTRVWQFDYNESTDVYTVNSSVNSVTVSGITMSDDRRPGSMFFDTGGNLWAATLTTSGIRVNKSTDDGATWGTAVTLVSSTNVGIVDFEEFSNGGTDYIFIFGSENSGGGLHAYYIDITASGWATAGNWTNDTSNIPALRGSAVGDDHLSIASDGTDIYICHKCESGSSTDEQTVLYRRTAGGTWSKFDVFQIGTAADDNLPSRPGIVVDTTNSELYVFATDLGSDLIGSPPSGRGTNEIFYKKAALSSLGDLETATEVVAFDNDGPDRFVNIILPRSVTSTTNLLAICNNHTSGETFYNEISISGGVIVNQATETDLSQPITAAKTKSIIQTVEADLPQSLSSSKSKSIIQTTETDISQAITPNKTKPLGQVIETNLAQPVAVSGSKIISVNQITETDTARIIAAAKTKSIGLNAEIDLAQLIASLKTLSIGLNTETDLAQSIGVGKTVQIGQATETDFAQIIAPAGNKIISVNQVIETDLAQGITADKTQTVTQVTEVDTALGSAAVKGLAVNQILESDSAFGISSNKLKSVAQVLESDLAQPITGVRTQVVSLGQVVEVDFPQSFSILKSKGLFQVTEIDLAQPITLSGPLVEPGCITANISLDAAITANISLDAAITATPDICPQ